MSQTKLIILFCFVASSVAQAASSVSTPKYFIGITPAEDRWVTLTSGQVYQGVEISYLLGQALLNTGKFMPIMLDTPAAPATTNSNALSQVTNIIQRQEREAQIPQDWKTWVNQSASPMALDQGGKANIYDIQVTPVVETLIYASGARSDRFVYGFSPDHLNPFNQGRAGAEDNGYVVSSTQATLCSKPDFFSGQFNTLGWGPFNSIFGSDFDQGVTLDIFGEGLGFKKFQYEVVDQIRFLIDDAKLGTHEELVFKTTAKGNDVSVWAGWKGISLSVDLQRGASLIAALQTLLPQIVSSLVKERFAQNWESTIIGTAGAITIGSGLNENVQPGLELITPDGSLFQVTTVTGYTATLVQLSGSTQPVVGEPVQVYSGQSVAWPAEQMSLASTSVSPALPPGAHVLVSQKETAAGTEKIFASQSTISLDQKTRAAAQKAMVAGCSDKKVGWLEGFMDSLFIPYGYARYSDVFDQSAKPPAAKSKAPYQGLRIALIDSGVDVKDSNIAGHLSFNLQNQLEGFDFISWDSRPSDDNGHGTAAAKLLLSLVKKPIVILPAKVIGPRGETSSSAVYDAFSFAVASQANAIVIPWSSIDSSMDAYAPRRGLSGCGSDTSFYCT